jgi:hypothetical protein
MKRIDRYDFIKHLEADTSLTPNQRLEMIYRRMDEINEAEIAKLKQKQESIQQLLEMFYQQSKIRKAEIAKLRHEPDGGLDEGKYMNLSNNERCGNSNYPSDCHYDDGMNGGDYDYRYLIVRTLENINRTLGDLTRLISSIASQNSGNKGGDGCKN